ncbi:MULTISPECIES: AAA family ATPase [Klebsiella]|uniref:AAA family ATPase n=1 Tax=Klebsiella TaxID=570 RepID=UPI00066957AA|nr:MULTISPECIES: AAA family ATPase [Klebsiella]MBD8429287.1 ATP-binding protein [Klebsiella pneumoniae]MDS7766379.1 AAA family ATPase [Klebsiella michiganensis]MDS7823653.1 AAA family ATPase [Klebsiella michiganensis]MDS7833450.1 AAA family ATPase [Klebsiella michiganensis]MDZ3366141.1 ATP-binding protein [Klebsiella pneumoniae]
MLVAFSLENYKSFRERQVLSFASSIGDEHPEHMVTLANGLRVNRFAALIGGNGVGKTQLIQAINEFANAIHNDGLNKLHMPFLLNKECRSKPTSYEAIIIDEDQENFIRYGISIFNEVIVDEYLYIRPIKKGAREQCIFTRDVNGVVFKKAEYKKQESLIGPILRDSGAVITFAKSLEIDALVETRRWALKQLPYYSEKHKNPSLKFVEGQLKRQLLGEGDNEALDESGLRIIQTYNEMVVQSPLHIDKVDFLKFGEDNEYKFVYFIKNDDGDFTRIGPDRRDEFFSQGTLNVLTFLAILIWASEYDFTLYVDEIDSSIHYSLASALIKKIFDKTCRRNGVQFIMSTHNIPLLDDYFRRDELNIIIKDSSKASIITNAANFSVRKDAKVSAKYLRGEFGTVPSFLGIK